MLSISKPLSPERAAWYFKRDDYYLAQEGNWYGSLSDKLNLSGPILREDFISILNGFDKTGKKLVASAGAKDLVGEDGKVKKHGHRSGIDLTFSAPKSVSILSYHDPRINKAFETALKATLDHVEKEFAYTRFKDKKGNATAVQTDDLLWATFTHDTSRELDPQLHTHCVLMNMTEDSSGEIKTIHNEVLYNNKMFLGQLFRNQLAQEIKNAGYAIEITDRKKGFFEIRGVGENVLAAFSKRSQQVREELKGLRQLEFKDISRDRLESWAKDRIKQFSETPDYQQILDAEIEKLSNSTDKVYESFSDAELAAIATTNSRVAKRDVSKEHVNNLISKTCSTLNTSLEEIYNKAISESKKPLGLQPAPEELLKSAVQGLTEGQSTFSKHNVIAQAMKMGMGYCSYHDFITSFEKLVGEGEISKLGTVRTRASEQEVFSSKEMIGVEKSVMELCKNTRGLSSINVELTTTNKFIEDTDISLKLQKTLKLDEKNRQKADVKFNAMLSKIKEDPIKSRLIELRNDALKNHKKGFSYLVELSKKNPDLYQYFEKFGYGFTPGQKDALRLITTTKDCFSIIQGDAGTGKSFSMLYAKQLLEKNGFFVRGLAPTGKAATGLASSANIDQDNCGTIDSFLNPNAPRSEGKPGREVWIVDEAGMCGSKKFLKLMEEAQRCQAKLVFVGDRKQFASIEAGRMFSELQDKAGIDMVVMPDVMRQKTEQTKDIVKSISLKQFDFAFKAMQGYRRMAAEFDKTNPKNYSIGNTIQFSEETSGLPAKTPLKVIEINDNNLKIQFFNEESRLLNTSLIKIKNIDPDILSVFEPPLQHNMISNYKLHDHIQIDVAEQGIPACKAEIVSISEQSIKLSLFDPITGKNIVCDFDPSKNPSNVQHIAATEIKKPSENYVNMITVEKDRGKSLGMVSSDYLESISARKDCLLITGTNKDKDELNAIIRPELIKQGHVVNSKEFSVFNSKSIAGTSGMAADSYSVGQIAIFNQSTQSKSGQVIPGGTQSEIISIDKTSNAIKVKFWNKEKRHYDNADVDVRLNSKNFTLYNRKNKEFGVGDKIIFLKNDKKEVKVSNGEVGIITKIDKKGNITAELDSEPKRTVKFNLNNKGKTAYNYIDHAYAITDYKSQGATTQRLLWYAPTDAGPISSNSFYVAITRCKEEVAVYTNDAEVLQEKVKQEQEKASTLDFFDEYVKKNIDFDPSEKDLLAEIKEQKSKGFLFQATLSSIKPKDTHLYLLNDFKASIGQPKSNPETGLKKPVSIEI